MNFLTNLYKIKQQNSNTFTKKEPIMTFEELKTKITEIIAISNRSREEKLLSIC